MLTQGIPVTTERSKNWIYSGPAVVAAIDALGVSDQFGADEEATQAVQALDVLLQSAIDSRIFDAPDGSEATDNMYGRMRFFGDSIYFFPKLDEPISLQSGKMVALCAGLLGKSFALLIQNSPWKILLRASVAYGQLTIKRVTVPGFPSEDIYIGSSVVRAHQLLEAQNWIGGAVDACVPIDVRESNSLNYEVPLKVGHRIDGSPKAINWLPIASQLPGVTGCATQIREVHSKNTELGEKECAKWENTIAFCDFITSEGRVRYRE